MKTVCAVLMLLSSSAFARDTRYLLSVSDVLAMPEAARLDKTITFHFGTQKAPKGDDRGEVVVNEKTNAVNKGDEAACRWAMLSALLELQQKARAIGCTHVVGIESYYKKIPFSSETEFECHAGAIVAGVALRAHLVR